MKNYTEELKMYWQSMDLTFIASFHRVNDRVGYFNRFINPMSGRIIRYPEIDEVEVVENRVSFQHKSDNNELKHEYLYKIQLEHTDHPGGKNNPYSLRIKKIDSLNQVKIKQHLKETIAVQQDSNIYFGCYNRISDTFCCFSDVIDSESGDVFNQEGEPQKVFVSPKLDLIESAHYSFRKKDNKGKLSNAIPSSIKKLEVNPFKDFIRLRFERLNNPEANKMIANLMREIGKGMYSSKQRMIFELLQNADDAPGKEKVEFHIDIKGEYFFVMHDGAPFNKDDVEAITSAAESTKRSSNKKTGYKGIGFKSVFTDSTEVWLKSGGYQFAFLRNSKIFENFDEFYFSSERYMKYPELLEEDRKKYRNQRLRFNGSTDIPWQVIPIWQNQLPEEFDDSNFNNFNNPVQFALRLGEQNIEDYKTAIDNITYRPQFLLFLRNTSKFRSPKNGVTVFREDSEEFIEITKTKRGERIQKHYYIKQVFEGVEVSDNAFKELNIGLKKESRINDYNEVSYYFTDLEGREIETIPPKLASVNETDIAFGISLIDNKISPESEYTGKLPRYSSLFTYLPMEDTRFQLPFLVNADFVPSSDRQRIQGDNLWNKYIMIKVAEKHVDTLSILADRFISDKEHNNTYLSLLLNRLLPDDDTAQQIIDSYNEKYLEQLKTIPFIVNDLGEKQLLTDTILDDSSLTKLLGQDLFYEIFDTQKRLPHLELKVDYLKSLNYPDLEIIDLESLAENLSEEMCVRIGKVIKGKKLPGEDEILNWLNELVVYLPDKFGKIPFIQHNDSLFSLDELILEPDAWILTSKTIQHEELIGALGYHTVNLQLDKYPNLDDFLANYDEYLNDKSLAYERIAANQKLAGLHLKLKLQLLEFLQNSSFMVGIGETKYYGEIKIFLDEQGFPRPLRQLVSRKDDLETKSILKFRIKREEYESLNELLANELIQKDEIFGSFLLSLNLFQEWSSQFNSSNINAYVNELKTFFSWRGEKEEIRQSQWAAIPWLYIDDEMGFVESSKVYWSEVFLTIQIDAFQTIKGILHDSDLKTLPLRACGELVKSFDLKTDTHLIENWDSIGNMDTNSANTLLDWMEEDGSYNSIFEHYTLIPFENEKWRFKEIEKGQIYDGSESNLKSYIYSIEELASEFLELNEALCSEKRYKLGILQGDKLLKSIIASKSFDQRLAKLLPQDLTWKQVELFVSNLPEFALMTNMNYDANSPEHIIVYQIIKNIEDIDSIPSEVQNTIDSLRSKITINQNPISDYDLSDTIQFGKGDQRRELKLSDVLLGFKGDSDVLDNVINDSFSAINQKRKLRLIFKTRRMLHEDICKRLEQETSDFYSVNQVVYQLLYSKYVGVRSWSKKGFADYWISQENMAQLQDGYNEFLDLILELDFPDLENFSFHDFQIEDCVDKNWAIPSEKMPEWLHNWVAKDITSRIQFISKLGFNGEESPIVKLRQVAISEDYDQNQAIRYFEEAKTNSNVVWNTIEWLSSRSTEIVTRNITLIQQINNFIEHDNKKIESLPIPIIVSINEDQARSYTLKSTDTDTVLYMLDMDEEFSISIFNGLTEGDDSIIIVDDNCGNQVGHFHTHWINLEESVDGESLKSKSELWSEPYYRKWELYSEYQIYIYNGGDIPYVRKFNNKVINSFTKDLKDEANGGYYVSKLLKSDVINNLPESFPEDALASLKDWHYKTLQDESLLDEDTIEYSETLDRLIQDRLGISKEEQKKESNNAKVHAIYFLEKEGYDISQVQNAGASLKNILNEEGNSIDCIVRSAKGGLLYIDKDHWDMLENPSTYLIVIYPGNDPRLFKDRLELLSEELAENVLFRVPNSQQISEVDGVFDALESESHLILVTSEKMKESLFSKLKQDSRLKKEEDAAVEDDDFKF